MKATNKDYEEEVIYTCGGRQKGDNNVYTFTSRPVHLLAASYLLLSPVHVQTAVQKVSTREREMKEYPSVSSRYNAGATSA